LSQTIKNDDLKSGAGSRSRLGQKIYSKTAASTVSKEVPALPVKTQPYVPTKRSQSYWATRHLLSESAPSISAAERQQALLRWGDFSLGYSIANQPCLKYSGDSDGFLAFGTRCGFNFVLGDPLCDPARKEKLLAAFLKQHRRVSFVQVSESTAAILERLGFRINEIGVDTRLDLATYAFSGKEKEWLRYADNWVTRRGFRIAEANIADHEQEIEAVSESWRKSRTIKRKEVRFLNRPIPMVDESGVRKFFLFSPSGRIEAFVYFDPLYSSGQLSGYVTSIKRRLPDCSTYGEPAILKRAIEQFQRDGVSSLWLGLSPLAQIENRQFKSNRFLHWTSRYLHKAGWFNRWLYNFRGHSQYKQRFRGEESKVYFASQARFNGLRLAAFSSLCGAF
jgi:lysylphosphatidylglycerol synthetase-like protein (DUF2156 family)